MWQGKQYFLIIILIITIFSFAFAEGQGEGGPGSSGSGRDLERPPHLKGTIIIPEYFLRGYDPITVFFEQNVGPEGGGPLDNPGDLLQITPAHPGEYRFIDSKTIQFLPTTNWPALKTFTIKAKGVTRELATLMIPPTNINPRSGSENLEPIKSISLTFGDDIGVAELGEMLSFEVKSLPGVGAMESYWLTEKDFSIKELDKTTADDQTRYVLSLYKEISYGKLVIMHIRLSLDESIQGALATYRFSTKPEFRLLSMGCGYKQLPVATNGSVYTLEQAIDCGTSTAPIFLEFTEYLAPLSIETVKKMFAFEPAVRDLRFEVSGERIYLYFNVDKETPYKLTVKHQNIFSKSGRPLALLGDTSFYFYFRQSSRYLQWKQGQAIVERYGPQLFPMQGRGLGQVDLRIYKIDPLNRNFWPFPLDPVAVDEETRPPMPGEEPAYGTRLTQQIRLLGTPQISQIIDLPISKNSGDTMFGLDLAEHLARIVGRNQAGTYLLGYRLLGTTTKRIYVRLTVTDLSLSTIEEEHAINFVVTSLNTGKPIPGARITIEGERDGEWITVINGVTASNGQFRYEHNHRIKEPIRRIIVSYNGDTLVLDPNNPPPHFQNNHWFSSSSRWLSWLNRDPYLEKEKPQRRGYIFTERPVYRPEEPVHIMGYIRIRRQGKIEADEPGRKRSVVVRGPGGKEWTYSVQLQGNGYFYVKFDEKDLPTGQYRAIIVDKESGSSLAAVDFKKEAYRIPRFEITISGPDRVPLDREFELVMTADYYAGGRVVGQEVIWEITQYPHTIRPPGFPGYIFSTDDAFSGGRVFRTQGSSFKRDVTDANGAARLKINPAIEQQGVPRKYVVEVTVRGADAQTVTAVKQIIALPSFAIGLKLDRFLKDETIIKPEIIIIDHEENPLAGKQLMVRLYQRQWHSYLSESDFTTGQVKYNTDVVDKLIYENLYTSLTEPLKLNLPVDEAGVYVVEVLAKDNLGRLQKIQSDLYVAGETPVSWKKTYANVFETSLDKKSYVPGENANLLLKSPFQDALALIVLEGPKNNEYYWVEVKNGQGIFTLPIREDMVPSIPVHALLLRGRLAGTGYTFTGRVDRGRPIAMANTSWINVEPVRNEVSLKLVHQETTLPGSKLEMQIFLADADGRPVNGEVALWLVDRAVLALGEEKALKPLGAFIDAVRAYITLRETRNEVVGNLPLEELPGGDMASKESAEEEGAERLFEKTTVRRNFQTVPYFNTAIKVVNGQAFITIDLPDNLTDFAIRAVATSGYDKFGTVKSVVSIRLPVIVQSALPRFVRPGDAFVAGGIGRIVEGEAGPGAVSLQVEGIQIQGKQGATSHGYTFQWEEKRPMQLFFPFLVPKNLSYTDDKEVVIRMAVERKADGATDGFEVRLPIKRDNDTMHLEKITRLTPGIDIDFPRPTEKVRPGTMRQSVIITKELAIIKLIAGLNFLISYEHGCTEQRISKFYPVVALKDALSTMGLDDKYEMSDPIFTELCTYLESCLTPSGLYSFWPGSDGYISVTAYVVEFLTLAKEAGYEFNEKLLNLPVAALKESLRSDYQYFISGHSFRERVEALTALARTNYYDAGYAHDLLVGALNSDLYTQAKILYMFLINQRGEESAVRKLLDALWARTVFKLVDEKEVFAGLEYKTSKWGGLILSSEIRTFASVARALYRSDPRNARIRLMIDELILRSDSSGWGSTSNNAAAIMALTEVLQFTTLDTEGHKIEINIGGHTEILDTASKNVTHYSLKNDIPGILRYRAGDTNNLPYVWLYVDYIPDITGDEIKARNNGFVVERELLEYGTDRRIKQRQATHAGQSQEYTIDTIIEEHVRVINPQDRNFVAVVVPFAAGLEIMNPELATASKDAKPQGRLTLSPSYTLYGDDQVVFYYDTLPKGTYDFYFRLRVSFEGSFVHPPAKAELMYDLSTNGRSDGTRIIIKPKP